MPRKVGTFCRKAGAIIPKKPLNIRGFSPRSYNGGMIPRLSFFFALLLLALEAFSFVARVSRYRGTVTLISPDEGQARTVDRVGMRLFEGERIETGEESFVNILMVDDTLFQVGSESVFHLEDIALGDEDVGRRAIYSMIKGKFRSIFVKKTGPEDSLILKAPSVSMGVRGTDILTDIYEVDREMKTTVALVEGKLAVEVLGKTELVEMVPGDILRVANMGPGNIQEEMGRLHENILQELRRPRSEGERPFLQDVLGRRDPSSSAGVRKREILPVSSKEGGMPGKEEDLLPEVGDIKREAKGAAPTEVSSGPTGNVRAPGSTATDSKPSSMSRETKKEQQKERHKAMDKEKKEREIDLPKKEDDKPSPDRDKPDDDKIPVPGRPVTPPPTPAPNPGRPVTPPRTPDPVPVPEVPGRGASG